MKMLILGGTLFLSREVAAAAVRHGHDVTCAARGTSGTVPAGAALVPVDRDDPDGLRELAGEPFDAVVDVATMSLPWVSRALAALGDGTAHWTFVSSINAYADTTTPGGTTDAELLEPLKTVEPDTDPSIAYGGTKVASEHAVRTALADRAFIVRPGLITGPGDVKDRFGYWANRISRGGRVPIPPREQPIQHIDVRDLAEWILLAAETGLTGTFDGIGPVTDLGSLLDGIAAAVAPPGTELVPIDAEALNSAGAAHWAGPDSMPLWAPGTHLGFVSRDAAPSLEAGLRIRPLADTARAALETERALGLDRPREAGLSAAAEARVFAEDQDTSAENDSADGL
ncbi:NAD-dependent epimerase/dehydratase family protein [Saccharopolyspora gloriosae]|uniref:NAD-dependent epimerase/dehydratase family protein n=1 Tax=Saccharopolyspora gloriosae TaxID=455344 RepID=UPI001FB6EA24|nr:NAD-dependent epimerase/dehydratase family protein [Saccharopolyspora gloriosae]